MVYASEHALHEGRPLYAQLVRRLREAGALGRDGDARLLGLPRGPRPARRPLLLPLRRQVPVVTVVIDTPERIRRWFAIVDELTAQTGLVTSETVPAFRACGPGIERGGLTLADAGGG